MCWCKEYAEAGSDIACVGANGTSVLFHPTQLSS